MTTPHAQPTATAPVHWPRAYISLGSNQDEPEAWLARARQALQTEPGLRLGALSPIYRTEPQGLRAQAWFANQVAELRCAPELGPEGLLARLLAVETRLGRQRSADPALRFGPRCIDLDVLLYGAETRAGPELILPHPRLAERAFVLVPLRDLCPDLVLPNGQRLTDALAALSYAVEGQRIYQ